MSHSGEPGADSADIDDADTDEDVGDADLDVEEFRDSDLLFLFVSWSESFVDSWDEGV